MASPTTFNSSPNVINGNDSKNVSVTNYSVEEIGLFSFIFLRLNRFLILVVF